MGQQVRVSNEGKRIADVLASLTQMQRAYCKARLEGMTKVAAATAAGQANPQKNAYIFEKSEAVQEALRLCQQITADAIAFGRKEAHDLLLSAYYSAATAGEQVMAVRELIKLHGLAAPEVKELRHQHTGLIEHQQKLESLPDNELARLAKLDDDPLVIDGEFTEVPVPVEEAADADDA